jgi:hypothetical protein
VRPVQEAVQIIEGSLGSQCLVWLFQVQPQGFKLLHVDARNLGVHLVDNCPAGVSLFCHGLLHGHHYHLEQGAPDGSHQPPSASTDECDRDHPDHIVCQHPGDPYQELQCHCGGGANHPIHRDRRFPTASTMLSLARSVRLEPQVVCAFGPVSQESTPGSLAFLKAH